VLLLPIREVVLEFRLLELHVLEVRVLWESDRWEVIGGRVIGGRVIGGRMWVWICLGGDCQFVHACFEIHKFW